MIYYIIVPLFTLSEIARIRLQTRIGTHVKRYDDSIAAERGTE